MTPGRLTEWHRDVLQWMMVRNVDRPFWEFLSLVTQPVEPDRVAQPRKKKEEQKL